jgi:hypothetical protein
MEADLVAHCGGNPAGSFAHTLTLTDIATGWTECVPLAVRQSSLVVDAVEHLRTTMPFVLRGIDTDNGSEFVNETMLAFCVKHGLELTRARPRRKNDQAWVEQKNGSVVRRMVGYGRLDGDCGRRVTLATVREFKAVREFLSTILQTVGEAACGCSRHEALPHAGDPMRPVAGIRFH